MLAFLALYLLEKITTYLYIIKNMFIFRKAHTIKF